MPTAHCRPHPTGDVCITCAVNFCWLTVHQHKHVPSGSISKQCHCHTYWCSLHHTHIYTRYWHSRTHTHMYSVAATRSHCCCHCRCHCYTHIHTCMHTHRSELTCCTCTCNAQHCFNVASDTCMLTSAAALPLPQSHTLPDCAFTDTHCHNDTHAYTESTVTTAYMLSLSHIEQHKGCVVHTHTSV